MGSSEKQDQLLEAIAEEIKEQMSQSLDYQPSKPQKDESKASTMSRAYST